jgi:hypothetical protein
VAVRVTRRFKKKKFVVGILRFLKWFDVDVLGFQIELCFSYFGLFLLEDSLGYFWKNWAIFFKSSGHPGIESNPQRLPNVVSI